MPVKKEGANFLQVLAGLPAIIAIIVGLAVILGMKRGQPDQLDWCRVAGRDAFDRSDFKTAAVCYARLQQAQPNDPDITFSLAQSLQAIGQAESAKILMARLTPPDHPGYLPAHLWLARQILVESDPTPASLEIAADHLSKAMAIDPDDPTVNTWLAILYAQRVQWDRVPVFANKSGQLRSTLADRLFQIAKGQNNAVQAEHWADSAKP